MVVIKRDGRKVAYDEAKIREAITNAFLEVDGEVTEESNDKINTIASSITKLDKTFTVEEIQKMVEDKLMASSRKDVARSYIIYRNERTKKREKKSDFRKRVKEKLSASNVQNQNANIDEHSFGGRIGEATDILLKELALDEYVSPMARDNHINNRVYIHDLNSFVVGMHNCCSRDTKFITKDGVYSFEDFENGDVIEVLTHDGTYKKAIVKSFGKQLLNTITFSRAGQRFVEEHFTANHRWILDDGAETTNLQIGSKILKAPKINNFDFDNATPIEQYYWCLGFVLGDGTNAYRWSHGVKNENVKFVRLRLCGDKVKYSNRFDILKHSTKLMDGGDLYLTFSSTIDFIKEFPNLSNMTNSEKLALFDGLYCADGQQSGNRKSILTTDEQIASFIEDIVPSLGYYIIGINDYSGEKTSFGGIRKFTKEYIFIGDSNKYYWTVEDIKPYKEDEVWCLQVEENHSFVLPNGIVTGNCLSVPFDPLLKNGFNTRQTDVRPANSISTAFQLLAVIFQLQSLMQFGGVSATHLDWTMIPYVRKSFYKHYNEVSETLCVKPFDLSKEEVENTPIDSEIYKPKHWWNFIRKRIYRIAMKRTVKELNQAVEGMYHNLNY